MTRHPSAWPPVALSAIAALLATPASAQTIRGLVLEGGTYRPVPSASVTTMDAAGDTVATGQTDGRGFFSVTAAEGGAYRLVVRALGYRPQGAGPFDVAEGALRVVEVTLEPRPLPVPGIDVETDAALFEEEAPWLARQGFYDRRKAGLGRFFGPADIEREAPLITYTTELFYRIPGVSVVMGNVGGPAVLMRGTKGGRCAPAFFVDGVRVSGDPEWAAPLVALEGAEVYTRPVQVPLQYQGAAEGCGVILLWTKG